jgi:hypothetical protein
MIKGNKRFDDDPGYHDYLSSFEYTWDRAQLADALDKALDQVIPLLCRQYDLSERRLRCVLAQVANAAGAVIRKTADTGETANEAD